MGQWQSRQNVQARNLLGSGWKEPIEGSPFPSSSLTDEEAKKLGIPPHILKRMRLAGIDNRAAGYIPQF